MPDSAHSNGLVHEHFILDAELESALDFEKRHEITKNLINELMESLTMQALGPMGIYDATDFEYPGWSFIQPITTSHISGHYFIEPNGSNPNIHMDLYSCKSFDWKMIIPVLHKYIKLGKWHGNFMYRKDVMLDRAVWEISGKGITITTNTLLHK
jgi:hypothetical protein